MFNQKFELKYIFISPIFYIKENKKIPSYFLLENNGDFIIKDFETKEILLKILKNDFYSIQEEKSLIFYDEKQDLNISLEFPDESIAILAHGKILTPPPIGFNHFISFLSSVTSFENIKKFFNNNNIEILEEFYNGLLKCINTQESELLLYTLMLNPNETPIKRENVDFYLSLIGNRFFPFLRSAIFLNWLELTSGDIILRQNTQLSFTCTGFLKINSIDYSNYIINEMLRIVNEGSNFISNYPFNSNDALNFIENVFDPIILLIFQSINKMPTVLRHVIRTLIIRTSGHYIDEKSPFLVIPNLLLLRVILPTYTEKSILEFKSSQIKSKVASLIGSSLLSLFYRNGWGSDKEPELAKLNYRMEKFYLNMIQFSLDLINLNEFDYDFNNISNIKGDLIQFFLPSAKRCSLMNLQTPNFIIHSNLNSISFMHLIEEWNFDFTKINE